MKKFIYILLLFSPFFLKSQNSVVDIIVNSADHNTLETAVIAADLQGTLSGAGPFTVFAPTDDAFAALDPATLQAALDDPSGLLTQVLTYHVLGGNIRSGDLSDGQVATTVNGKDVTITFDNGNVFVNNAQITMVDIAADNGVVHVINAVLLPPRRTVVDIIVESPDHNTAETAVIAADLQATLSGDGPFTVLAPTDDAFATLDPVILQAALDDPSGLLTEVLTYHVLSGDIRSSDLSDGQVAMTVNGKDVTITIDGGNVFVNDAQITVVDLVADNGVVHVIDAVLLPPTRTVVDIIVESPDHNTLETAVLAAELQGTLSGDGPFTVFAPTDDAFAALDPATLQAALDDPSGLLTQVLTYHVLGGDIRSTDLTDGQVVTTVNGKDVTITFDNGNVFVNNAQITMVDIVADNGVVHVINAVLLPPNRTVVDIIVESDVHNTLETAVIAANLQGTLSGDGPFTVFAPTDNAFAVLDPATLQAALDDPSGLLTQVLTYHVLGGDIRSTDLSDGQTATTVNGQDITVSIDVDNNVFINNAQVTIVDLVADNGVVHVIDMVLLPMISSVENQNDFASFNVYPNPAINIINVEMEGLEGNLLQKINMIDAQGKITLSQNMNPNNTQIDVSGLNTGLYILEYMNGENRYYKKVMLKK